MPFIIDGHNFLFRLKQMENRKEPEARRLFINALAELSRETGREFVVVFDGPSDTTTKNRSGGVEIWFGSRHESADQIIQEIVRCKPHQFVLVTADKRLAHSLLKDVQRVETPEEFYRRLRPRPDALDEPPKPSVRNRFETNFWLREFGFDPTEPRGG